MTTLTLLPLFPNQAHVDVTTRATILNPAMCRWFAILEVHNEYSTIIMIFVDEIAIIIPINHKNWMNLPTFEGMCINLDYILYSHPYVALSLQWLCKCSSLENFKYKTLQQGRTVVEQSKHALGVLNPSRWVLGMFDMFLEMMP